jgi:hypothetical protein
MGNPHSSRARNHKPACDFSGTLDRLEDTWRSEARFRLLLLGLILVICFLSENWLSLLSAHLPSAVVNSGGSGDQTGGVAGLTGLLLAFLRIWPEARRCRLRIAGLQNSANQIQFLAERRALGLKVSEQEWEGAFEAAQSLLGAGGHIQDDERIHPILEAIVNLLHLGNLRSKSPATAPSPTP